MEENNNHTAKFVSIGIILRFPIFLIIAFMKIFIAAPFEFVHKLVMLWLFVIVSILKYKHAVMFSNNKLYQEWMNEWSEVFPGFFHLNAFYFKEAINFLKYGEFSKTLFKVL